MNRWLGLAMLSLMLAACSNGGGDPTTTTTTTVGPETGTTVAPPPATAAVETTIVTTTTSPVFTMPEFTIVERTDDNVLVVAVPPGTYTDIDLQNLVGEVVERFAPVNGLHIVDDETVVDLVLADSVSDADQALLDEHYFLRLEDGFRMVFLGPFSDVEDVILGS